MTYRLARLRMCALALGTTAVLTLASCGGSSSTPHATKHAHGSGSSESPAAATEAKPKPPPYDVYAHTRADDLSTVAARARPLVYVPNNVAGTMQVIDPTTYRVIHTYPVPSSPEHVSPDHSMRTLYVSSDAGNAITPINPLTGVPGQPIAVPDVYNLYFNPQGNHALVMASRLHEIEVRDAKSFAPVRSLPVPCTGINHADFTADLKTMVASCEFSGQVVVTDADATRVEHVIDLNHITTPGATSPAMAYQMGGPKNQLLPGASAMPQDVRLSPDGKHFLIADMLRNGVWVFNAKTFHYERFIHTGLGAHGIYPSRDSRQIYVTDRDEGAITVLDARTLKIVATWHIPGGGSPDMGGVTADGKELWLSGRYNSVVYVIDTTTGQVTHRIPVNAGPHGLLVWPQPGRFSLGHTGNMR
jgi:YVTN family beta-propeller protein